MVVVAAPYEKDKGWMGSNIVSLISHYSYGDDIASAGKLVFVQSNCRSNPNGPNPVLVFKYSMVYR